MLTSQFPTHDDVQKLLCDLFNRNVVARKSVLPPPFNLKTVAAVGAYSRDDGTLRALWACDLAMASNAGAALSIIPKNIVAQSLRAGKLTQELIDNLREVVNIGSSLFNLADTPHVALSALYTDLAALPPDVTTLLARPKARLDLEVTIPGYGPGNMTLRGL